MKELLKSVDAKLGHPIRGVVEDWSSRKRMAVFEEDRQKRRGKFQGKTFGTKPYPRIIEELEVHGYSRINGAVDKATILKLREEFEAHLNAATCLLPVSKDSARKPGDRSASSTVMTQEELKKGQEFCRTHTNNMAISEPMVNCKTTIELAFHEMLFDIAYQYLDCVPGVGGMNLRKSFANNLSEFDTLFFHVDPNSPKFLKFFFYLNEVDENGGPFCYVRGSHKKRFKGWQKKYRWTSDEIAEIYGKENILNLTANVGDIIVADTNGFHRGTKVSSCDRSMLTIDYVIHTEFDGKQPGFKISQSDVQRLSEKQRAAADFLQFV